MSSCDVCDNEPMKGVASIPGMPVSVAYGENCLRANAHPWWALVGAGRQHGDAGRSRPGG